MCTSAEGLRQALQQNGHVLAGGSAPHWYKDNDVLDSDIAASDLVLDPTYPPNYDGQGQDSAWTDAPGTKLFY